MQSPLERLPFLSHVSLAAPVKLATRRAANFLVLLLKLVAAALVAAPDRPDQGRECPSSP